MEPINPQQLVPQPQPQPQPEQQPNMQEVLDALLLARATQLAGQVAAKANQRLPEIKKSKNIKPEDRILSADDILATMREVIRLNNDPEAIEDQIDHLGNRRVRTFTELLLNSLKIGMMRLNL